MKKKFIAVMLICLLAIVAVTAIACEQNEPPEETYKITYNLGFEGAAAFDGASVKKNEKFILADAPEREGYDFLGWNDGEKNYPAKSEYVATKDTTFVGQWREKSPKPVTEMVTATFLDADGEIIKTEKVTKGGNAKDPGLNVSHKFPFAFSQTGWDKSLVSLTEDTTFSPVFSYIPTELDLFAYTEVSDGYKISVDRAAINEYTGDIVIPEQYNGKPVIEVEGFSDISANGKLYVPGSVKKIDKEAFASSRFTDVIIGEGVEEIREDAFRDMGIEKEVIYEGIMWPQYHNFLDSMYLPSTLKTIVNLTPYIYNLEISEGACINRENDLILSSDRTKLICVLYSGEDIDLEVPSYVTEIPAELAYQRYDIVSLTFYGHLKSIGDNAFSNCGRIKTIEFAENAFVEEIGIHAFYCLTNFDTRCAITLPSGLKKIGAGAFYDTPISLFTIPDTVEELGEGFVSNVEGVPLKLVMSGNTTSRNGKYTLEDGVLISKGTSEFEYNGAKADTLMIYASGNTATSYTTPQSCLSFHSFSFSNQLCLKNLTFAEGVTVLPQAIAQSINLSGDGGSSIVSITLPSTIRELKDSFPIVDDGFMVGPSFAGMIMFGTYAPFLACEALETLIIPDNAPITKLPSMMALNSKVKTFKIPKNIKSIGAGLFGDTIESYEVASGNTEFSAEDGVLYNFDKSEIVAFPRGYKKNKWTAPENLRKVGADGMYGIYNLEEIDFSNSNLEEVGAFAFEQNFYAEYTENWEIVPGTEKGLKKIIFPSTLKKVGDSAFSGDMLLEEVIFTGDAPQFLYQGEYDQHFILPENTKITAPEGKENDYLLALFNYNYDEQWALSHLSEKSLVKTTYTFDANGGSLSGNTFTGYILIDYPIPTRQGKFFAGWYTQKDGGELVLPPYTNNAKNVTLYAKWVDARWETGANYAPYSYGADKIYDVICMTTRDYLETWKFMPILWIEYEAQEDIDNAYVDIFFMGEGTDEFYGNGRIFDSPEFNFGNMQSSLKAGQKYYIAIMAFKGFNEAGTAQVKVTVAEYEE